LFGRPIGQNQGSAFPLAEASMHLDAAELAARHAAARYDGGEPCGKEANTAKYASTSDRNLSRRRGCPARGRLPAVVECRE
jgi:acyl-CoA dehydrogenase